MSAERRSEDARSECEPGCELDYPHTTCARLIQRPPVTTEPCGCGLPTWLTDEDDWPEDERFCEHWAIEDVPTNRLRNGDIIAIRGDLPLEVSWHVVEGDADPATGRHQRRSFYSLTPVRDCTPFEPDQPTRVLRVGMVGRQTLEPGQFGRTPTAPNGSEGPST